MVGVVVGVVGKNECRAVFWYLCDGIRGSSMDAGRNAEVQLPMVLLPIALLKY